jgi:hypothetical protein
LVIEEKVGLEAMVSLRKAGIALEINLLIFDSPPEPLCENVIKSASLAILRNLDVRCTQSIRPGN